MWGLLHAPNHVQCHASSIAYVVRGGYFTHYSLRYDIHLIMCVIPQVMKAEFFWNFYETHLNVLTSLLHESSIRAAGSDTFRKVSGLSSNAMALTPNLTLSAFSSSTYKCIWNDQARLESISDDAQFLSSLWQCKLGPSKHFVLRLKTQCFILQAL